GAVGNSSDLGQLSGGTNSVASAISSGADQIAGWADDSGGLLVQHAVTFATNGTGPTKLNDLTAGTSAVLGISEREGVIPGLNKWPMLGTADSQAMIWDFWGDPLRLTDTGVVQSLSAWNAATPLITANSMDSNYNIYGYGKYGDGTIRFYKLAPALA